VNVSFFFARRYLFAKKSRNIINVISSISLGVVAFVATAMILVMSAFSGLENLIEDIFSNFDAPITITAKEGTFLSDASIDYTSLKQIEGISEVGKVIEHDVWLNYGDQNTVATLKGVEPQFVKTLQTDSILYTGKFILEKDSNSFVVVGVGVRGELLFPINLNQPVILSLKAPIVGKRLSTHKENAFNEADIQVSGTFSSNAELDKKYVFTSFKFAQELFELQDACSAIEIQLSPNANVQEVKSKLVSLLPQCNIQTREDKNAIVYKTNASEKWATYLILVFILIIASFNILASLTLLIIEKKQDIFVLYSMGATKKMIRNIFVFEGIFINFIGALVGTILGVIITLLQQNIGLVRMEGAIVEYYPMDLNASAVFGIFITAFTVGSTFCILVVPQLLKRFSRTQTA